MTLWSTVLFQTLSAAEGKPQPATEAAKVTKPAAVPTKAVAKKKPVGGNIAVKRKPAVSRLAAAPVAPLKKKKIIPVAAPESSESEEESSGSTGSSSEDSEDSGRPLKSFIGHLVFFLSLNLCAEWILYSFNFLLGLGSH